MEGHVSTDKSSKTLPFMMIPTSDKARSLGILKKRICNDFENVFRCFIFYNICIVTVKLSVFFFHVFKKINELQFLILISVIVNGESLNIFTS